jgi:hypothetical protein
MEHQITLEDNIFEIQASGSASPKGFIALFDEIIKHENWSPGGRVLIDFRDLSDFNTSRMDFSGLSSVASFIKRHGNDFGMMKTVTLLRDTMDSKVVSGLLNSLHEFYGSSIEHEIFTDYTAAIKWLKTD